MEANIRAYGRVPISILVSLIMLVPIVRINIDAPEVRADGGAPQLAYVAGGGSGVGVIDIASQREERTFTMSGQPQMALLSPDGQSLYLAQPTLGRVSNIDTSTGQIHCAMKLAGQPSQLALSLDASVLYAAGQGDSSVRALNPQSCAVERTFQTHEAVYGLALAASAAANATPGTPNQLWICGATTLTVFEATGRLLGTLRIEAGPRHISIPGGFSAYITTNQGSVLAVDLNSRRILRTLLQGGQFGPMDYDATTGQVYVPDQQHHQIDVLTPVSADTKGQPREPAQIISLNGVPQSVAITNDGQLGFVALASGNVVMLDIPARHSIASIHVGGTPRFIITGLYPPTLTPPPPPTQTAASPLLYILPILLVGALLALGGLGLRCWRIKQKHDIESNKNRIM